MANSLSHRNLLSAACLISQLVTRQCISLRIPCDACVVKERSGFTLGRKLQFVENEGQFIASCRIIGSMNKYHHQLLIGTELWLKEWLNGELRTVPGEEVRRFLHKTAGTAGTVGWHRLSQIAMALQHREECAQETWGRDELSHFLHELTAEVRDCSQGLEEPVFAEDDPYQSWEAHAPLVLLLDDDYVFIMVVKEELERRGYMVLTASHSEQAARYVQQYRPDAIMIDLHLQEGSGLALLRDIGDELAAEFIPVTVVSADDTRDNRLAAYKLGADDFVAKPLDVDEWCGRLARQLRKKSAIENRLKAIEDRLEPLAAKNSESQPQLKSPVQPEPQAQSVPQPEPSSQSQQHQATGSARPVRAAIVDDDNVVRTMLQDYIRPCFPAEPPVEIRSFRDGEAFMNDPWSRDSTPCLVVLDRMMPRMDGIEVLMRLRQSEGSRHYTVLMLTNRKSEDDIVKALALGADDYVTKPFSLKELEARIRRLVARRV